MSLKKQVVKGSLWTLIGQIAYMLVALLTNVILSRFLTPFEFGQMGILMFFITVATIFTESGFGGALIRMNKIKKEDYSTAFIVSLSFSTVCFIILVCFSGSIANYYHDPSLQKPLIVTSLILFISAFSTVQNAMLIREMRFKQKNLTLFASNLIAAVVAIFSAYKSYGLWALIIFQLLTPFINIIILFFTERNILSFTFSKISFKELYSFGINTTLTSILATAFDNVYQLILGRYFSISHVGLYYQAKKLQMVPFSIVNSIVQSVLFSSLSKLQNDKEKFITVYNKLLIFFSIVMGSITAIIFLYSKSLIIFFYGEKWEGAAFFMQLLCIASFFYFQELFNNIIFKVFNETKKIFYLEIAKKIIQIISIIVGIITLKIEILLYGFLLSSAIGYYLNFYYSRKLLGKRAQYEIIVIVKVVIIAIITVTFCQILLVYFNLNFKNSFYILPIFILLFLFFLQIFKTVNLIEMLSLVKSIIRNKNQQA